MSDGPVLLDTDILSAIIRKNPNAISKAESYLIVQKQFTFSIVTRYEILRGLKAKNATKQLMAFEYFCSVNIVLPMTDEIIVKASDVYASLKQRGNLIGDADILIASTALVNGLPLVTNNLNHFERITELSIQNWLQDE